MDGMKTILLSTTLSVMMAAVMAGCADKTEAPVKTSAPDKVEATRHTDNVSKHDDHHEDAETHSEAASSVTRSANAHSHGDAELAIVLEGAMITVELETPLYNLLGFEHHPETAAQKAKVEMTEGQLQKGEELFVFNAEAKCNLISDSMTLELFDEEHEDDEHHDEHDEHDDDEHHDEQEDSHKDVLLQYQYRCTKPSSLENVSVNLFEFFEDMSDIDVTYLGPSTQKQVSLTRKNTQMDLSQ